MPSRLASVTSVETALASLRRAWPRLVEDSQSLLGNERLYQAILYRALRDEGSVPAPQISIDQPFDFAGPPFHRFEPDVAVFRPGADGEFRNTTLVKKHALLIIEMKAVETFKGRRGPNTIRRDVQKLVRLERDLLASHRRPPEAGPVALVNILIDVGSRQLSARRVAELDAYARDRCVGFGWIKPQDHRLRLQSSAPSHPDHGEADRRYAV